MIDLEIDLDDGSPPIKAERTERKRVGTFTIPKPPPVVITITKVPVAIAISYARVTCLGCGKQHKDHRGIFIKNKLSNGVVAYQRVSLRELVAYTGLPRVVDEAPAEATPICSDCWSDEGVYRTALASAQVEGEPPIFGDPRPIEQIAEELDVIIINSLKSEEEQQ